MREENERFWMEKGMGRGGGMGSKSQVRGIACCKRKAFPVMRMREKERMNVTVGQFITVGKVRSPTKRKRLRSQDLEDNGEY